MPAFTADLRSDTFTRPTPAMREAIARAEVGDDVFGEDPEVNALEDEAAARVGKEAALFLPSGTMANQVAIRVLTERGDELIAEAGSHCFVYEAGGAAALSQVQVWPVAGVRGILDPRVVEAAVRAAGNDHYPRTRLLVVEDTSNRGGGSVYPLEVLEALAETARRRDLRLHLDGARLWNAVVASGVPAPRRCAPFDTVSFCLSKGLGAPVGSMLCGTRERILAARRARKLYGGGMRQAGVLAAAGRFALRHHVGRLAEDHARARRLAEGWARVPGVSIDPGGVETNMVYADVSGTGRGAAWVQAALGERGIGVLAVSPTLLRAVTHLDVDDAGIEAAIAAMARVGGGTTS